MSDRHNKLFHVLVVVGASMTGGCGGATAGDPVDPDAARDAAADARDASGDAADDHYVGISPPPCGALGGPPCDGGYPHTAPADAGTDSYVGISPPPPPDAGEDGYPQIAPALDGSYPPIR
jgi:hypothetical protein